MKIKGVSEEMASLAHELYKNGKIRNGIDADNVLVLADFLRLVEGDTKLLEDVMKPMQNQGEVTLELILRMNLYLEGKLAESNFMEHELELFQNLDEYMDARG